MQKIIEQLYYGEININEYFDPKSKKPFKEALHNNLETETTFLERLPDEMKNDFEQLIQNLIESASMEYVSMFTEGFQLGARLMLEILSND